MRALCWASACPLTRSARRREKGDASKARDYLPADKQYLLTRGVPCLRRASTLAYTDADEDAERLLSLGESSGAGDEWVETHTGRVAEGANPAQIDDIPDVDDDDGAAERMGALSLGKHGADAGGTVVPEIPDMDEIPDMEEELEEAEDVAAASKPTAASGTVIDAAYVP